MRPEPRKRIDTQGAPSPLAGLGNVLAGLDFGSLPAAPDAPPVSEKAVPAWKPGRVILRRERAHRSGKTVIVVDDFATHLPAAFIERVAARLRSACGCGGTVKGRSVEVQGDQPDKIRSVLEGEGFTVAGIR